MGSFFKACSSAHSLPRPLCRGIPEHRRKDEGQSGTRKPALFPIVLARGASWHPRTPRQTAGELTKPMQVFQAGTPFSREANPANKTSHTHVFTGHPGTCCCPQAASPAVYLGQTGFTGTLHIRNSLQSWDSSMRSCK